MQTSINYHKRLEALMARRQGKKLSNKPSTKHVDMGGWKVGFEDLKNA